MLVDHDLLSIQHARIAAENAVAAQKALAALPQERLDAIVRAMGRAVADRAVEAGTDPVEWAAADMEGLERWEAAVNAWAGE